MQTRLPGSTNYVRSLDDPYYFADYIMQEENALFQHVPRNADEIPLSLNDVVSILGASKNGRSYGKNIRLNVTGYYPSYKTVRKIKTCKMPIYTVK